jgi:hypothetical protein
LGNTGGCSLVTERIYSPGWKHRRYLVWRHLLHSTPWTFSHNQVILSWTHPQNPVSFTVEAHCSINRLHFVWPFGRNSPISGFCTLRGLHQRWVGSVVCLGTVLNSVPGHRLQSSGWQWPLADGLSEKVRVPPIPYHNFLGFPYSWWLLGEYLPSPFSDTPTYWWLGLIDRRLDYWLISHNIPTLILSYDMFW